MTRASDDADFSAPDSAADDDPSPLRRLVLDQMEAPEGAAVRLLTTATLAGPEPLGPPEVVGEPARALGLDPAALTLFSPEAYLLQSALGERALDGGAGLAGSPVVACNYHEIPPEHRPAVEERLRRLRDLGPVLDPDVDVDGPGAAAGPRILVAFYDAYRDAALFGADLCHRLGLRAWFFPVFRTPDDEPGAGELTDAELADLATAHELGFHTASHTRAEEVTPANLAAEVTDVHARLTGLAGRPPRLGAWLGGSRFDDRHLGDRTLRDLGLPFLISNWAVERVPAR